MKAFIRAFIIVFIAGLIATIPLILALSIESVSNVRSDDVWGVILLDYALVINAYIFVVVIPILGVLIHPAILLCPIYFYSLVTGLTIYFKKRKKITSKIYAYSLLGSIGILVIPIMFIIFGIILY